MGVCIYQKKRLKRWLDRSKRYTKFNQQKQKERGVFSAFQLTIFQDYFLLFETETTLASTLVHALDINETLLLIGKTLGRFENKLLLPVKGT